MEKCFVLVGNSSSGIHEASSFLKPVINIGTRQNGRLRSKNIIDVTYNKREIFNSLKQLNNKKFYNKLINNLRNPYYYPNTSSKILRILKKLSLKKKFFKKE